MRSVRNWQATLMNRGWAISLAALVLSLAALMAAYKYFYPTYSYRYRLTVNVEVDQVLHSGSSIIEVTWYAHFLPELVSFSSELRGQATLVDLGNRGVVAATLINGEDYGPAKDGAWGAVWIAARAFGLDSTIDQLPRLPNLSGKRVLAPDDLPRFLWFSNPQDPATARKILVQEFPTVLGPPVRFAGASVEITSDPIVIDIRSKLPWLKSLEQKAAR
jgi:hypothetical protein